MPARRTLVVMQPDRALVVLHSDGSCAHHDGLLAAPAVVVAVEAVPVGADDFDGAGDVVRAIAATARAIYI